MNFLESLQGKLVVSCQPVVGSPLDTTDFVIAMARAAIEGGAAGLRIEGVERIAAVRAATGVPIIGIIKRVLLESDVCITPLVEDITALAEAGADIIAIDATQRERPCGVDALLKCIGEAGKLAMADCATLADGKTALSAGAEVLGTTLSGYAGKMVPDNLAEPDFSLIKDFVSLGTFVMAEGRFHTPALAQMALASGANSVTVGSAITRLEHVTGWFATALAQETSQ